MIRYQNDIQKMENVLPTIVNRYRAPKNRFESVIYSQLFQMK